MRDIYFIREAGNARMSFAMSGSSLHAAFKSRGADVQ